MSQKQQKPLVPEVKLKPLAERFVKCPELARRPSNAAVYTCLLIEEGEPCNRVNYDEQAYPWGLCISLPLQKDKEV